MPENFDPTPYIPPRMLEYLKFPWLIFGSWVLVSAAILFAPLPENSEAFSSGSGESSDGSSASSSEGSQSSLDSSQTSPSGSEPFLRTSGKTDLALQDDGEQILAISSELPSGSRLTQNIDGEMTAIHLQAPGRGLIAQAHKKAKEQAMTLEDQNGTITYKIVFTDEGLNVFSPTGEKLYRIKVKEDKFNLLDGSGNRLLHGKGGGTVVVKDEPGGVVGTATFSESLSQSQQFLYAGEAFLPIPPEFRALLLEHSMRGAQ